MIYCGKEIVVCDEVPNERMTKGDHYVIDKAFGLDNASYWSPFFQEYAQNRAATLCQSIT